MSESSCPRCGSILAVRRSGYGAETLFCPKCGYEVDKGKAEHPSNRKHVALARETEMGWEPPLTLFTVILQFTVGAYLTTLFVHYLAPSFAEFTAAPLSTLWVPALVGMGISAAHGKNPKSLIRIVSGVGSSYLGREVVLLGVFALLLLLYPFRSLILSQQILSLIHDYISFAVGVLGIAAMIGIYVVPARPCWRHFYTPLSFVMPAATAGPLYVLLSLGFASENVIQSSLFGLMVAVLVASFSVIDLLAYRIYRLYLNRQGDETKACLAKLDSMKAAYRLKVALRLLTASLCLAAIPLGNIISLPYWLTYTALCFALSLSAEVVSRGLFYVSVGSPVGEERFLRYAKEFGGTRTRLPSEHL